jgi:hypothetical protein
MGDEIWSFSASDTMARAPTRALYRPGAVAAATLMIVSAMWTLANLREAAWSAVTTSVIGSGS